MPTIQVNDIQMYYEIHGAGEPLVFIGGLGNDVSEFESITHWLAKTYQVLAFDNRGAGRTAKPNSPYSIEMMADDTEGLMHALDIPHAHIVGISMGGRIALALTLRYPQRVDKLVLVSTSAQIKQRNWWFPLLGLISTLPILSGKYPQPYYAHVLQRQASSMFNCTDKLHALQAPTLILHGKKDTIAPYLLAEEMHASIAGSEMLSFAGGHLFFLISQRQPFLDAVTTFLG
jgi:pimeloyl-ACP methyl ester carboxylesterase